MIPAFASYFPSRSLAATTACSRARPRKPSPRLCIPETLDVILMDPDSPTGMAEAVGKIRRKTSAPLVILSALTSRHDKITALDAGADDYLTKPVDVPELLARLRAIHRRAVASVVEKPVCQLGELQIDMIRKIVTVRGETVRLSRNEYAILAAMARCPPPCSRPASLWRSRRAKSQIQDSFPPSLRERSSGERLKVIPTTRDTSSQSPAVTDWSCQHIRMNRLRLASPNDPCSSLSSAGKSQTRARALDQAT